MTRTVTPADVLSGAARWCVVHGDSAEVLATLPAQSVDAVVTDPPSGIAFMGAEWDGAKGGRAQWVAWLAGILALARAATVPGGRAFVWALPRTTHWTGCAVEDAGWHVENVISHLFGTGWPKGQSQLKPSSEHWYLARTGPSTPLEIDDCRVGTSKQVPASVSNPTTQGYGGGGRSGCTGDESGHNPNIGRWPPNTLFSHAPGCVREGVRKVRGDARDGGGGRPGGFGNVGAAKGGSTPCAPGHASADGTEIVESWRCVESGCPVAELAEQSGVLHNTYTDEAKVAACVARKRPVIPDPNRPKANGFLDGSKPISSVRTDPGTAARFFPQFEADDATFAYIAKPSRAERDGGCEDIAPIPQSHDVRTNACGRCGRMVKANGSVVACECGDLRVTVQRAIGGNHHNTVKSVALMRWLIRLVSKPGDVILDPFGGSGTTGVAALAEGRRVILVERESKYVEIILARLQHAAPTRERLATMATEPVRVEAPDFGPLFSKVRP